MKKNIIDSNYLLIDLLGCLGEFDINDNMCRRKCALSLRCAVEQEQKVKTEIIEDLLSADNIMMKIH